MGKFPAGKGAFELRASLRLLVAKILLDFKSELGVLPRYIQQLSATLPPINLQGRFEVKTLPRPPI